MQNFPQLSHVTGTLFLQTSLTMFRNIENNSKNLTAYEESDFVQARALFYACMGPGGRGTPLHRLYRYVQCQRVWFFSRFGLK